MAITHLIPTLKKPLSLGASGPEVKALQVALNGWNEGVDQIKVDGRFGKSTHHAVLFVQWWEHLKKDGVVGPKTAEKLGLEFGAASGTPITIRFDEPPRSPMTPPLALLVDVIIDGMRPLRDEIEDALLRAPKESVAAMLRRRDSANESYDDLVEDLKGWANELPQGNLAVAKLRTAFHNYIQWMHSELKAAQFDARGGWIWRYHPVLDQIPVDQIVNIADRVLRGEQSPVVAMQQIRMTFEQFNRMVDLVPHYDANGVGPEGKASVT